MKLHRGGPDDDSHADVYRYEFDPYRPPIDLPHDAEYDLRPSTAGEMADEQIQGAVQRIYEDTTRYPQFPWAALADLAGPMCPEDLILVGARTGGGKSLFLQNVFDHLVTSGIPGLYVGLEQSPKILRVKWACMRQQIPPKLVLATRPGERGTTAWEQAMEAVNRELAWQKSPEIKRLAHFSAARTIDAAGILRWTDWAVNIGCRFVVIDHIDRVKHGEGRNPFHEISETIRLAKELAVRHQITMLVASQVGRPGDALEQFMPPALHNLRGAGTKEEEADTVLGVYRPLKQGTTVKQMRAVRQGLADRDTIIEPDIMGVMVLKHRLDGPVAAKKCALRVHHGQVLDRFARPRVIGQEVA